MLVTSKAKTETERALGSTHEITSSFSAMMPTPGQPPRSPCSRMRLRYRLYRPTHNSLDLHLHPHASSRSLRSCAPNHLAHRHPLINQRKHLHPLIPPYFQCMGAKNVKCSCRQSQNTSTQRKKESENLLKISCAAIGVSNNLLFPINLANHVQHLGSWKNLCNGLCLGTIFKT